MMSNLERLAYMANQIAANFATLGQDAAAAATADHLTKFWDPRMRDQILGCQAGDLKGLGPEARAAIELLRESRAARLPS